MKKTALMAWLTALVLACALGAQEEPQVEVLQLAKTTASWDGRALAAYPQGQPEITISRVVVPPGVKLPWHKHPVITAGVVLKGQLTVVTDQGERLHLKAGESIVEVFQKWHQGSNDGDEPTEIVVFYAGVEGTPIVIPRDEQ
ncbi:MAG TPA: cupin domain-containing protein [Acidobacteriota bacterium]|nr:cupin domain-containing protein [Acidobacteriota bacterium]